MKIKKINESNNFAQNELKKKFQQLIYDYSDELTSTEFSNDIVEVLEEFHLKHKQGIDDLDNATPYATQLLMSMRRRIEL